MSAETGETAVPLRDGREAGFTLVELIVAFSLLALIVAMLGGGLRFGAAAWSSSAQQSADLQGHQAYRAVVRRLLAAAVLEPSGDEPRYDFVGLPNRIGFVGGPPAEGMGGDRYAYVLRLDDSPPEQRLVLLWRALFPGDRPDFSAEHDMHATTLLREVSGISLAYLGGAPHDPAADWRDHWTDDSAVPSLVRVSVSPAGSAKPWPALIVAIRHGVPDRSVR